MGADMALELEALDVDELVTEHIPGVLNALADTRSRTHQPGHAGEGPDQLQCAKRKRIDLQVGSFVLASVDCIGESPQVVRGGARRRQWPEFRRSCDELGPRLGLVTACAGTCGSRGA